MSKASEAARARMLTDTPRVPTIAPAHAVNRAKQELNVPTPPTDPLSPNGVAEVNGLTVTGADTPSYPLPDGLTGQAVKALEAEGLTTLQLTHAKTDAELLALSGVGQGSVDTLRAAERAAGLG